MKKVLVLGGTQFIGRNLVEIMIESGVYDITLFNRQRTENDLFTDLSKIKGDRETADIKQISKEQWDYVIDLSCYYPESLTRVLDCLNGDLTKYVLISTCSVYDNTNNKTRLRNEDAEILSCNPDQAKDRTTATYGNRKAECERILSESGIPHVILRPALVYGRYDHTDRLYYWLYQVQHHDRILIPDKGERKFSITYVMDLVRAIMHSLHHESEQSVFNVITVPQVSIGLIIKHAEQLLDKAVDTVNAEPYFLKANGIEQWTDMPLWIDGDFFTYSNQRMRHAYEFEFSDFCASVKDTIAYYTSLGWPDPNYGMTEKSRVELMQHLDN